MTSDWERMREVLGRALEISDAEERALYLDAECGRAGELRDEVDALLAQASVTGVEGFLDPPDRDQRLELSGTRFNDFIIEKELGVGGMGVVYKARQKGLNRDVALKVLVNGPRLQPAAVERFHREARAVARLVHPNIVRVLSQGADGELHWFAMDLVPGHDLAEELRRLRGDSPEPPQLPPPGSREHGRKVAQLGLEATLALEAAHGSGLVHRDIKPSNMLLHEDGHLVLVDFGIVHDESLGTLTGEGQLTGSINYMSPEQTRARSSVVDHRTDIYSLGIVLYEMGTLICPFESKSVAEFIRKVEGAPPPSPRSHNAALAKPLSWIITKATAKNPKHRYGTAHEMAEDLRAYLEERVLPSAGPPSPLAGVVAFASRSKFKLISVAIALTAMGVGAKFASVHAARKGMAKVSAKAIGPAGEALSGQLWTSRSDPATGLLSAPVRVGVLPVAGVHLAPGWVHFTVALESGESRTFPRQLEAGSKSDLETVVGAIRGLRAEDFVRIEGGSLKVDDMPTAPWNGLDVPVSGFLLQRTEVSNETYAAFLQEAQHPPPPSWEKIDLARYGNRPVVDVTWDDARAFAEWAGLRLPTFTEWTWAARGNDSRLFPWGSDVNPGLANAHHPGFDLASDTALEGYLLQSAPVESFEEGATPEGVLHLYGNVAEWTASPVYFPAEAGFQEDLNSRVIAGFAFNAGTVGYNLSHFAFSRSDTISRSKQFGFRCAADLAVN